MFHWARFRIFFFFFSISLKPCFFNEFSELFLFSAGPSEAKTGASDVIPGSRHLHQLFRGCRTFYFCTLIPRAFCLGLRVVENIGTFKSIVIPLNNKDKHGDRTFELVGKYAHLKGDLICLAECCIRRTCTKETCIKQEGIF